MIYLLLINMQTNDFSLDFSELEVPGIDSTICFLVIYLGATTVAWFTIKFLIRIFIRIIKMIITKWGGR